jgi:hypothetical protein
MKEGHQKINRSTRACALLLLVYLVCTSALLHSIPVGDISWNLSVSADSIYIGDQFDITLELTHSDSIDISIEGISANLEPFEVVESGEVTTSRIEGVSVDSISLSLITYETGEHILGPFEIYLSENGFPDTILIDGTAIHVITLIGPDAEDIKDIKGVIPASAGTRYGWILVILLLVLILSAFVVWKRRRRRSRKVRASEPVEPPVPPDTWALGELLRIEKMELLSRGKVKKHYILVSEVFRRYISMRYRIVTLERTTAEILDDLEVTGISPEHYHQFSRLLQESDLVKFAKWNPDTATSGSFIQSASEAVRNTGTRVKEEEASYAVR